jgi:hypothetical protein
MLQRWHDFFILTGTAAATLLGLVFVAGSIAATIPNEKLGDIETRSLWVTPIVAAFIRVLVVSTLGVIPDQSATSFGYFLSIFAVLDLGRMMWITRGMREVHMSQAKLTAGDWWWYVIFPLLATLSVAAAAFALAAGQSLPAQVLAVGLIGHLVIGVHNTWELVDWLATRQ